MTNRINHQDIVNTVLKSKAVDFNAIGKTFAELGPSLSLADEPWEFILRNDALFYSCIHSEPVPRRTAGQPVAGPEPTA